MAPWYSDTVWVDAVKFMHSFVGQLALKAFSVDQDIGVAVDVSFKCICCKGYMKIFMHVMRKVHTGIATGVVKSLLPQLEPMQQWPMVIEF